MIICVQRIMNCIHNIHTFAARTEIPLVPPVPAEHETTAGVKSRER